MDLLSPIYLMRVCGKGDVVQDEVVGGILPSEGTVCLQVLRSMKYLKNCKKSKCNLMYGRRQEKGRWQGSSRDLVEYLKDFRLCPQSNRKPFKSTKKGVTRAITLFKKSLADVWRMDCSGLVIVEAEKIGGSRSRPGG